MLFCGLPGGSPGPNAQASWGGFLLVWLIALAGAGGLFWLLVNAHRL